MMRTEYLNELRQDAAFTWRQLLKNPGFTAVAVLTLALHRRHDRDLQRRVRRRPAAPDAARSGAADARRRDLRRAPHVMSVGNYVDTNAAIPDFEGGLSALNYANYNLADDTTPERVVGARVSANYVDVMGVRPMLGRTFTAEEDRPGRDDVVVLSHRLWTRRLGADFAVVGRTLRMNGATCRSSSSSSAMSGSGC